MIREGALARYSTSGSLVEADRDAIRSSVPAYLSVLAHTIIQPVNKEFQRLFCEQTDGIRPRHFIRDAS